MRFTDLVAGIGPWVGTGSVAELLFVDGTCRNHGGQREGEADRVLGHRGHGGEGLAHGAQVLAFSGGLGGFTPPFRWLHPSGKKEIKKEMLRHVRLVSLEKTQERGCLSPDA